MKNQKKPDPLPLKIYYEDTDAGGVVYHANYLRYMERARSEWLAQLGYEHRELAAQANAAFVVSSLDIRYKVPARLDDRLEVRTTPTRMGPVRIVFEQEVVFRDSGVVAAAATVEVACVDPTAGRIARMPRELVSTVEALYPELAKQGTEEASSSPSRQEANVALERATRADVDRLAGLNQLLLEEERYDRVFAMDELRERMRGFLDPESGYDAFFITHDRTVAGYALVNRETDPVYIRQFYIDPGYRRRGLGRQAVNKLLELYGTTALDVEVMAWNTLGMRFWEALGFKHRYNGLRLSG